MKLRKRKLFSSMAFVLSLVMLMVSGAIFVHSAQQQSATSSLSVTFSGQNVNFEAQGWYHVDGGSRTAMVNNDDTNTGVSFSATDAPNTVRTLKISNTEAENKAVLTSEHPYVLFTYKFVNTASSGAFGMEVSLSITPSPTNLKAIKYYSSDSLYTEANLDTFKSSVSGTSTFSNEFIVANNGTKYFYILFEIDDLTLPVTFNPSFDWTVVCSNSVTAPASGYEVTITYQNGRDVEGWKSTTIYDDWYTDIYHNYYGSGDVIGSIDSADGTTKVYVTTGKIYISAIGGASFMPPDSYEDSGGGGVKYESIWGGGQRLFYSVTGNGSILIDGQCWDD